MKISAGFTIVELLVAIVLLAVVGGIGLSQYRSLQSMHRDQDRKVAINAMHHNLKEVVFPTLKAYPRVLGATQLKAMDKNLLKDPDGKAVGTKESDYRYEPTGCNGGDLCQGYTLRADLELEADFVKSSF